MSDKHTDQTVLTGSSRVPVTQLQGWHVTDGNAMVMALGGGDLPVWLADVEQGDQVPQVDGADAYVTGAPSATLTPNDPAAGQPPILDATEALRIAQERRERQSVLVRSKVGDDRAAEVELVRLRQGALSGHQSAPAGTDSAQSAWACAAISQRAGHDVDPRDLPLVNTLDRLREALADRRIATRRVRIDRKWLNSESEPAVVFTADRAVAMVPGRGKMKPLGTAAEVTPDSVQPYGLEVVGPIDDDLGPVANLRAKIPTRAARLLGIIGWVALAATVALPLPIGNALVFGRILPAGDSLRLWVTGGSLLLLVIIATLAAGQLVRRMSNLRAQSDYRMQMSVWAKAIRLPVSTVNAISRGEFVARVLAPTSYVSRIYTRDLAALMIATFSLVSLGLMFLAGVLVGLVGVLFTGASLGLGYWNWRKSRAAIRAELVARNAQEGAVTDVLGSTDAIQTTDSHERMLVRLASAVGASVSARYRSNLVAGQLALALTVMPTVAIALIIAAVWAQGAYAVSVSAFTLSLAALAQASTSAALAGAVIPRLAAGEREFDESAPIVEAPIERSRGHHRPRLTGKIRLQHGTVEVSADLPPILDDVSLEVPAGQFLAVVGPSGAGKSTLVRAILGFEELSSGSLYFDDEDINKLDIDNVRSQIGVVLQQPRLFDGTLRFNVTLGRDLSDEQVRTALSRAGADDILAGLADGLDTMLTSDTAISGGQRQRIAIARAIVNEPAILVLDEATSALDNASQAAVTEAIDKLGATRLVIAHRFSTIQNADRVIVVDQGRIVESGTVPELMAQGGLFAAMAERQLA